MDHSVRFDEEQDADNIPIAPPKPMTAGDALMQMKLVKSPAEALIFLLFFASVLIATSIYLLASAVPHQTGPAPEAAEISE